MNFRLVSSALACLALLPVAVRPARAAGGGRLKVEVVAKDRVMTGIYKVYADAKAFPDRWLAGAIVRNTGDGALSDVSVRFRVEGYTEWSTWSTPAACGAGERFDVPYHPVLDRRIAELQATTPIELKVEWRAKGADGSGDGATSKTIAFLGGHEFVFCDVVNGTGSFAESFGNAPLLAAWVSRDDPVIKQFAALASRNAGGVAAVQSIEHGLETLRAAYELMLLNDFVYKSSVGLADPTLSFDNTTVQNIKYPRDVLRDKSGTCIELAILHAAIAHQLGIDARLALVHGHCFPIFELTERHGDEVKVKRVPVESTGIRGGLRGMGMVRVGFDKAVELAERTEKDARAKQEFIEVNVGEQWTRGIGSPELSALPDDSLERWGITAKGLPGVTLPDIGNGATKTDVTGFGGNWAGTVKARFGGPDMKPYRLTLVVEVLRGQRYKLLATFVPEGGGETIQEESVAEDQDGQIVFQGKSRTRRTAKGASVELAPGRGAGKLKEGKLVGKYGADGEGFASFTLDRT